MRTFQGYPWIIFRVCGDVPSWRIMIHEYASKIHKTLLTFDQKIAEQARHARDHRYQLILTTAGEHPDRTITVVRSLEVQEDDYLVMD